MAAKKADRSKTKTQVEVKDLHTKKNPKGGLSTKPVMLSSSQSKNSIHR